MGENRLTLMDSLLGSELGLHGTKFQVMIPRNQGAGKLGTTVKQFG